MKKLLSISLVLAVILILTIQEVNAQTDVGVGLLFGTEVETIGLDVRGIHMVTDNIAVAPDLTVFLFKERLDWFEVNLNANYVFDVDAVADLYALAGLNIAFITPDIEGVDDDTNIEAGLNIGGGVTYPLTDFLKAFGELRLVIGDADQLVLGGGLRYNIN